MVSFDLAEGEDADVSRVLCSEVLEISSKELLKLGRQHAGQHQLSGEFPSRWYSSSLIQAHLW